MVKYYDYLTGKNAIIVLPSPVMAGRNLGKDIDNYDVVIRVNRWIDYPVNRDDYGHRCNALYLNGGMSKKYDGRTRHRHYICCHHNTVENISPKWFHRCSGAVDYLRSLGSVNPLMGMIALADVLLSAAESVTFIGFDFYQSGSHDSCYIDDTPFFYQSVDNCHKLLQEAVILKKLIYKHNKLIIPEWQIEIFNRAYKNLLCRHR